MRIETVKSRDHVDEPRPAVWLEPDEYQELLRAAESFRDELILRLGGEVGLRSFEIPQIEPSHVKRTVVEDGDYFFLRVPEGKDTTGGGGKSRDAYLPRDVERLIHRYRRNAEIGEDEPLVDLVPRSVQRVVQRTAAAAAEQSGERDFAMVRSHDLRRYFGHQCLAEKRMNPRVVMDIGGWDSYSALEPYLSKPSTSTIVEEFERSGMA
ncbi:site-specific integrase [Haloarchaeobius sp. DFWS5]|uniref:site-specific integrase n=1 Tax=Haloarchaeobius sp. DFWS5 TaxID=3446114 RepID=UPI003EB90DD7